MMMMMMTMTMTMTMMMVMVMVMVMMMVMTMAMMLITNVCCQPLFPGTLAGGFWVFVCNLHNVLLQIQSDWARTTPCWENCPLRNLGNTGERLRMAGRYHTTQVFADRNEIC